MATCVIPLSATAQEQDGRAVIKTADGFLIVSNEKGNYFTMELKGKEVQPLENPAYFTVDGKFFQVISAEKKAVLDETGRKISNDREMLEAHRDWESDYISKTLGTKIKVASRWEKLANGLDALVWNFDMPKLAANQTARKQLYITVLASEYVLGTNSVVTGEDDDEATTWKLLLSSLGTLKLRDRPLSLIKASEAIRRGEDPTKY